MASSPPWKTDLLIIPLYGRRHLRLHGPLTNEPQTLLLETEMKTHETFGEPFYRPHYLSPNIEGLDSTVKLAPGEYPKPEVPAAQAVNIQGYM